MSDKTSREIGFFECRFFCYQPEQLVKSTSGCRRLVWLWRKCRVEFGAQKVMSSRQQAIIPKTASDDSLKVCDPEQQQAQAKSE